MKYLGIVIDRDSLLIDGSGLMVDIGVAVVPSFWLANGIIPCMNRTDSWLNYYFNRMSWPGMTAEENLICKVC